MPPAGGPPQSTVSLADARKAEALARGPRLGYRPTMTTPLMTFAGCPTRATPGRAGAVFALAAIVLLAPAAVVADSGQVTITDTDTQDLFVTITDNLAPGAMPMAPIRVDQGQSAQVAVNLDGQGHYNIGWSATDAVQPPTKIKSGSCSDVPYDPCNVDLFNASPIP